MTTITEQQQIEKDQFTQALKISLGLHIAIVLIFTVRTFFFSSESINFEQAIRVDMVGLPDKIENLSPPGATAEESQTQEVTATTLPALIKPPLPTKVQPQQTPKDKEAINLDKTKAKQKQAMEKLKQMSALEQIQKELESDKKKGSNAKSNYKGNILSPGSALTGVNRLQAENYISTVHGHITANWYLPEYLQNKDLQTSVIVRFDENGNILSKAIVKSSGNPQFDEYVLAAIQKSSPVPPPPEKFMRISSFEGFLFNFRQ